jgi:hemerythrin-like domain-containing protein
VKPTEQLKEEHRVIERALSALDALANALDQGKEVPAASLEKAVDFLAGFADKCHHGKEENHLFPVLEQNGIPRQGGPLGVMLMEHDQGRGYIRGMREAVKRYAAGDKSAIPDIVVNARDYVNLLHHHILKEDNILFRMADEVLNDEEQENLLHCFHQVEEEEMGEEAHERYLEVVSELEREAGSL